jgi:hypothetical protein
VQEVFGFVKENLSGLFLADSEDSDLVRINRQLRREVVARQERESDITRLSFSSLQAADLEAAQQTIRGERRARAQDRRISGRAGNTSSQHRPLI